MAIYWAEGYAGSLFYTSSLSPLLHLLPCRPVSEHTAPPPTLISSYIVSNLSLLPDDVVKALRQLDSELEAGELTKKGYMVLRASLLQRLPSHLVRVNDSIQFGAQEKKHVQGVQGGGGGMGDSRKVDDGDHIAGELILYSPPVQTITVRIYRLP